MWAGLFLEEGVERGGLIGVMEVGGGFCCLIQGSLCAFKNFYKGLAALTVRSSHVGQAGELVVQTPNNPSRN